MEEQIPHDVALTLIRALSWVDWSNFADTDEEAHEIINKAWGWVDERSDLE